MKKIVLFVILGMLAFSSCSKSESTNESFILGLWYYDTSSDTRQYKYTDEYKEFCQTFYHDSTFTFDESVQYLDRIIYGYWDFSSTNGDFFYQYNDGSIKENTARWSVKGDVLTFGATVYELTAYDKDNLAVRHRDTAFYYDENHQKKIAKIEICNYSFVRDLQNVEPIPDPWSEPGSGD